jgi:hypothetical protein
MTIQSLLAGERVPVYRFRQKGGVVKRDILDLCVE